MQNLPSPETYEKEYTFMPWGVLVKEVIEYIEKNSPKDGEILDLLCGPGYIADKIKLSRFDLNLTGVDLNQEFIEYARNNYSHSNFVLADVLKWESDREYDVILCLAGLHHLPYKNQEEFLNKISRYLKKGGFMIIGDPYIGHFENETERKIASAKLGYEYLVETIKNEGPEDVVKAAMDVMSNDVLMIEYKNSVKNIESLINKLFSQVKLKKTWPSIDSDYGDYYFILKK